MPKGKKKGNLALPAPVVLKKQEEPKSEAVKEPEVSLNTLRNKLNDLARSKIQIKGGLSEGHIETQQVKIVNRLIKKNPDKYSIYKIRNRDERKSLKKQQLETRAYLFVAIISIWFSYYTYKTSLIMSIITMINCRYWSTEDDVTLSYRSGTCNLNT